MGNLVWAEGLISSGKSLFTKEISKRVNGRVIEEPVETNPYLEDFYKNPEKYSFPMQIYLLHVRYCMQQLASYESTGVGGCNTVFLDRSLAGDRVFAKMLLNKGYIEQRDWETYNFAYNAMCRSLLPPTLLIYLDVQPITAFNRMKKRNRGAEAGVTLEYLQELHAGYQELLKEAEQCLLPWGHAIKICRIPWDFDIHSSEEWDAMALTVKGACRDFSF